MHLNDEPLSLYDVLELTPDATPQEIRSAYLRLKSSYGKDNISHYTLFSREETEAMLQNIENAYVTLSNPERRRSYDQGQGFHAGSEEANPFTFGIENAGTPVPSHHGGSHHSSSGSHSSNQVMGMESAASLTSMTMAPTPPSVMDAPINDLDQVILNEQNWSGPALRRVREARRITLEDLSDYTRISRTYLAALEEEDFNKLPALVYVRGFLQQVSKRLKLPSETVSFAYLARLKNARPDK